MLLLPEKYWLKVCWSKKSWRTNLPIPYILCPINNLRKPRITFSQREKHLSFWQTRSDVISERGESCLVFKFKATRPNIEKKKQRLGIVELNGHPTIPKTEWTLTFSTERQPQEAWQPMEKVSSWICDLHSISSSYKINTGSERCVSFPVLL